MEPIDREKAAQVWARVQAPGQTTPPGELSGLILTELEDAAVLERLAGSRSGKQADACRQIAQRLRSHAACLRGICIASSGTLPECPTPSPSREAASLALRRCCGRQLSCLRELEARASHPEYGPIYAQLASETRSLCRELLAQLGQPPREGPRPGTTSGNRRP